MHQINQLIQVLKIREGVTREAVLAWQQAKEQFNAQKAQHDQLVIYRQDYMQQLVTSGQTGCQIGQMRNRIEFIEQVDRAMAQLSQHLGHLAKQRKVLEEAYIKARAEQKAVMVLIDRLLKKEKEELERREQKELDEHALKQWYSKESITSATKSGD